jgi:hypothetical protein
VRSGSDERVTQPPWTHDFGPGFRCDLGSPFLWILSFGEAKAKYLAKGETL